MEMESGYTRPFREDKYVCEDHFDDAYLKQHIARNGQVGTCSYCGKKHIHVLDMRGFMDFVTNKLSERLCPLDYANLPLANSYLDNDNDKIPGFSRAGCYITPDETEQYESTDDLIYHYGLWTSDDRLNSDISSCFAYDEWIRNEIFEEDLDAELSRVRGHGEVSEKIHVLSGFPVSQKRRVERRCSDRNQTDVRIDSRFSFATRDRVVQGTPQ